MDNPTYCFFCNCEMVIRGIFNYEDFGLEGEGKIAVLHCPLCNCIAEFYLNTDFTGGKYVH